MLKRVTPAIGGAESGRHLLSPQEAWNQVMKVRALDPVMGTLPVELQSAPSVVTGFRPWSSVRSDFL
jgi:hypothetical protein